MKKVLFLAAALTLVASAAFAGAGVDLSVGSCPGNAGSIGIDGGAVDCAGGAGVLVLATWAPAEDIPDLLALDSVLDSQVGGDLDTNGFWNWDVTGCNTIALASSQSRPTTGCATPTAYTATWSLAGSGTAISSFRNGGSTQRLGCTVYRPGTLSVVAQQKLFGFQLTVDGSTATEAGGTCDGCPAPFCLVWNQGSPRSNGAVPFPTDLGTTTGNFASVMNFISFNSGGVLCAAVPTKVKSWGQLKSLYR